MASPNRIVVPSSRPRFLQPTTPGVFECKSCDGYHSYHAPHPIMMQGTGKIVHPTNDCPRRKMSITGIRDCRFCDQKTTSAISETVTLADGTKVHPYRACPNYGA